LRWKLSSRPKASPRFVADVECSIPPDRIENQELRATLVNHSTVLLQQREYNILTDPIWSERAGPVRWLGPRRRRSPGIEKAHVPRIDIVLISHNHYDHLDLPTLRWLDDRDHCSFVVPAGLGRFFESQRLGPVHELDWGESRAFAGVTIHCVPAAHFSARHLFDRNRTLWCGYVIESRERVIYFAGDTAFSEHFERIRESFGSPDLSLLPVGAFRPRWFMSPIHMAPHQAVQAHEILSSKMSIAIHYGTFQLGDDSIDEPREQLSKLGPPDSFLLLNNGQSATLAG
jgi:L-ascorbate metabolism protein UlaG (beta-lactamase superfamily)